MRVLTEPQSSEQMIAILEANSSEPVMIRRNNRDAAVLISPEEFQQMRVAKAEEFEKSCRELSTEAQARGLTEDILNGLLAEIKIDRAVERSQRSPR